MFLGEGASNDGGVVEGDNFYCFNCYIFGNVRKKETFTVTCKALQVRFLIHLELTQRVNPEQMGA